MNTTASGDTFRDVVAGLLRSAGYDVVSERRVGSKKADLYYEERRRGKTWKVAVETKNYAAALTRSDLRAIHGEYEDGLSTSEVNEVMVVSPRPVTAADANGYLERMATISHRSLAELQEDLLQFDPLLYYFRLKHEQDGLEHYYVKPQSTDGNDLLKTVGDWLDDTDFDPIAIIAGYGMGKTSFARHLTYTLATAIADGNRQARIPVLINLGGISREQGVEGLIGTALTGNQPAVRGYAFPLFHLLNNVGRFVIILDGFDEMKHMMTESEFKATFQEINRLVTGRAKVIILGRPTAFISENEQAFVLRGIRKVGSQLLNMTDAPKYRELRLRPFTPDQVRRFLTEYFRFHHNEAFSAKRIIELESSQNDDLLARPVHAKMFAELATDENFVIGQLTRFDLYDHFVRLLIEREEAKVGRGTMLKSVDRREFSCDLAWHLWVQPSGAAMGCRVEDLPDTLFDPYLPTSEDPISLRRALLSGSFLDEKSGSIFFFAHRSFQEFLVAEYIFSNLSDGERGLEIIADLPNALTTEVYDFIKERNHDEFFMTMLSLFGKVGASFPRETFDILVSSKVLGELAASRQGGQFSAWAASIWIARLFLFDEITTSDLLSSVQTIGLRAAQKPGILASALRTLLLVATSSLEETSTIARCAIRLMFSRPMQDIEALSIESTSARRTKSSILQDAMFESVSARRDINGKLVMSLDSMALFESLEGTQHPIQHGERGVEFTHQAEFDEFFEHILPEPRKKLRSFFENDAHIDALSRAEQ